jgi:hypothetical protein
MPNSAAFRMEISVSEPNPPVPPQGINDVLLLLQSMGITVKKRARGAVRADKVDRYADLKEVNAEVLTKLNGLGVIWTCEPTLLPDTPQGAGRFVLRYELLHVASETARRGEYPLGAGKPQEMGSAITYARRYALLAVTGVAAEDDDDDGQGGTGTAKRSSTPRPREKSTVAGPGSAPPLPTESGPAGGAKVPTDAMMRKLMAQMREAGITGDARHGYSSDMLDRTITSGKQITFDEMRGMIDAFEKALKDPNTAAATVIDIYKRTSGPAPAKATAARKVAAPARSVAESVTGTPAGPTDEAPPWESEPPIPEWPETAVPGDQS